MKNQELTNRQNKADQALSLEQIQSIRIRQFQKEEQPKNTEWQQKSRLDIEKKEKQQNSVSHQSSLAQEEQSKRQLNNYMTEFAAAWKLQTGFGILMIEKVSQIVHNYYKMIPEMAKRNQEIQILVIYNKSLLEIMGKFEDHERKLLSKLRTVEELNVKIMRQLCIQKNRQFKPPQIKEDESIFAKFSLKDLKYEPAFKEDHKLDENYVNRIKNLMKNHLIKSIQCLPTVESTINQLQEKEPSNIIQNQLEDLKQLKQKIIGYNRQINNLTADNMFDLYNLSQNIKNQLKHINLNENNQEIEKEEKKFVQQVLKIHSGLTKMQESELQTCLKMQKQTRKRIKKQRIKEQEVFLRVCEKAQSENTQLKKDIGHFKQKIITLQQQLNKAKAQLDFKSMKQRANKSSLLDDSMINQTDVAKQKKQLNKQTHKAMQTELKKLKDQNEKLQKKISQNQTRQLSRPILMSRIRQRAKSLKINIDSSWQQTKIIEVLLQKISDAIKKQPEPKLSHSMQVYKQDELISPRLQQKLFGFGNISQAQFLKTIQQKNETQDIQQIQNKIKELEKQIAELRKKNQQNKKLLASKDQVLRKTLEDHQADLKLKNSKINQLVKQYQQFQTQIKQLRFHNQLLRVKNEWAERLSERIIRQIQQITIQDICPSKSLLLVAELFQKLKVIIVEYQQQIKKQEQAYDEKRQVNIRQDMSMSRNAINSHDQSAISHKSMFPKLREKNSQLFTIVVDKQQYKNNNQKFKKIKSLTNEGIQQIEKDQRFIKKSPKKTMGEQMKDYLKSSEKKNNLKINSKEQKKSSSRQEIKGMDEDSYDFDQSKNRKLGIEKKSSTQLGLPLRENNKRSELTKTVNLEVIGGQKLNDNNNSCDVKQIKSNQSANKSISKLKNKSQNNEERVGIAPNSQANANQNLLCDIDLKSQKSKDNEKVNKQGNKSLDNANTKINDDNPQKKSKLSKRMEKIQNEAKQIQNKIQKQKSSQSKIDINDSAEKLKAEQQSSAINIIKKESKSNQLTQNKIISNKKDMCDNKMMQEQNMKQKEKEKEKEKPNEQTLTYPSPTSKSNKTSQLDKKKLKQITLIKKQSDESQTKLTNKNQGKNSLSKKNTHQLLIEEKQEKQFKDQLSKLSQQTSRLVDPSEPIIRINNVTRKQQSSQSQISKDNQKSKRQPPPQMSRNSSIDEVNLSYSKDGSVQKNKYSQFKSNNNQPGIASIIGNNSKIHYFMDKDAQDDPLFHQKVLQKLDKLNQEDPDGLDFFELYKRYKQAIDCLDTAEKVNRMYEIRYQKFVSGLKNKQKNENFSYQEQLFYMQKLIDQQTVKIQLEDKKYSESVLKHIKISESLIQRQLKMMRQQFNAENGIQKPKKRL